MNAKRSEFVSKFNGRVNWLYSQWGEGVQPPVNGLENERGALSVESKKIIRNGQLFIQRNNRIYTLQGQQTQK